jgi:hypothetical protein
MNLKTNTPEPSEKLADLKLVKPKKEQPSLMDQKEVAPLNNPKRVAMWRHGKSRESVYKIWVGMKQRCSNPKCAGYHNYGGRGIQVCERWEDFILFSNDIGPRPSGLHQLDRIDNNGNYEPGNVRWVLQKDQFRNYRRNVWLDFNGLRMTQQEFCDLMGVEDSIFSSYKRYRGGSMNAALYLLFKSPTYRTRFAPNLVPLTPKKLSKSPV